MPKRNNNSKNIEDWTTKKLKDEYMGYYSAIHELECYGRTDMFMLNHIERELTNRNVEINLTPNFN